MTFTREKFAGGMLAIAACGAVVLAPMAASAGPSNTSLQATLVSSHSGSSASGTASYHSAATSTVRTFDVRLSGVSILPTTRVRVFLNGTFVASTAISSHGTAHLTVSSGVPAAQLGSMVKVLSGGKVISAGSFHMGDHS